jgi:glycosyltransferase involved in cell wall biosynthesis
MMVRAREIARHAAPRVDVRVLHKPQSVAAYARLWRAVAAGPRPDAICVYDVHPRELLPAAVGRLRGLPVIVETGDVAAELIASAGAGALRVAYRRAAERAAWRWASVLAARAEGFVPLLADLGVERRIEVVPEGVDRELFRPLDPGPGRALLGLRDGEHAVGVVGSIVWNPVTEVAYGWELVDALPDLPPSWKAVIVGSGDGLGRLRARAEELGVAERLITPGRVPHERVPELQAALDAVTWTQTPDLVGIPRLTLKLPEYLACGKYVLASDVGAARDLVEGNGERVPYAGGRDRAYAHAIAKAVAGLPDRAELDRRGAEGIQRSAQFAWDVVARRFCEVVEVAVGR